jgi:hypothetical protein
VGGAGKRGHAFGVGLSVKKRGVKVFQINV